MKDNNLKAIFAVFPVLFLVACGGDAVEEPVEDLGEVAEVEAPAPAMDTPRVEITEPLEGATVQGQEIRVGLTTYGARVEPADNRQTPGRGHHHIFINEDVTAPGAPIPPTTETIIHLGTGAEEFVIPMLPAGQHRVIAVFAYGDHVPNTDVAADTVNFTVAAP